MAPAAGVRSPFDGRGSPRQMNALRRDDRDALFPGLLDSALTAAARDTDRFGG